MINENERLSRAQDAVQFRIRRNCSKNWEVGKAGHKGEFYSYLYETINRCQRQTIFIEIYT